MPLLQVKNLTKRFGGLKAVNQMSFDIREGEIVGLIGPNGAGKTTLFNLISGILNPEEGEIALDGRPLKNLSPARRSLAGLGRTFQIVRPFTMTVLENVMVPLLARNFTNGFQPATGGIVKTFDLLTREPADDAMPWWSLPETIRAALAAWRVAESDESRRACLEIAAGSHNAFVTHYVRPQTYLMAVKVRDARGDVLDVVPAYPDADPGYHTALSLMDALDLIRG